MNDTWNYWVIAIREWIDNAAVFDDIPAHPLASLVLLLCANTRC